MASLKAIIRKTNLFCCVWLQGEAGGRLDSTKEVRRKRLALAVDEKCTAARAGMTGGLL